MLLTGRHPSRGERAHPRRPHRRHRRQRAAAALRRGGGDAPAAAADPGRRRRRTRHDPGTAAGAAARRPRQHRRQGAEEAAAERYASVPALADDLRRYLAHEPVSARPDSLGYRAGKVRAPQPHRGGPRGPGRARYHRRHGGHPHPSGAGAGAARARRTRGARGGDAARLRAAPALARRGHQRPQQLPALRRGAAGQALHRRRAARPRRARRRARRPATRWTTASRSSSRSAAST